MTMRDSSSGGGPILTLEPLLAAVREGVELAGWVLSGLQKTTSHEFEGRWAGESTRSAYLFFHRPDLPDSVSAEAFLDETSRGLQGNLTLVVEGPTYGELGRASSVLERVAAAASETFPPTCRVPLALRLRLPESSVAVERAEVQVRIRVHLPEARVEGGELAVQHFAQAALGAFEQLLERPEVAELLPPIVD
jgi:hypothetical protein